MGTVVCGNAMAVNGVNTARNFRIILHNEGIPYAASNTNGSMGRVVSAFDWQGVYMMYGHTPVVFPGDNFTFTGSTTGTQGVSGAAICERIRIMWDVERGAPISALVFFASNGAFAYTGAATDVTVPNPPTAKNMFASFGSALTNVRKMELEISSRVKPYSTADTLGWVKRNKGAIDAKCSVDLYTPDAADLPTIGTDTIAKFYVTETTFWELKWMHNQGFWNFETDHESDTNVSAVLEAAFTGYSAGGEGYIKNPAIVTKWPT